MRQKKSLIFIPIFVVILVTALYYFNDDNSGQETLFPDLTAQINSSLNQHEELPKKVQLNGERYHVSYSFDEQLTLYIKRLLSRFSSDYTSIVVMDNDTGKVLALIDYDGALKKFGKRLSLSNSNPAASIFKVVTAASLLRKRHVDVETEFEYRGKGTTLYKGQLKNYESRRWVRKQSLKKAFALSNNVVFGRAAQRKIGPEELVNLALNFGFNNRLLAEHDTGSSSVLIPKDMYQVAELASGFNKKTNISPLHGALIASIIARDGELIFPRIITHLTDVDEQKEKILNTLRKKRALESEVARKMRSLMGYTITNGTARSAFIKNRSLTKNLEIGGKTGSITGGLPYGKRDWFISYAIPKNLESKGISVSVMIVNDKKWYVRSTYLAKEIYRYYYSRLNETVASRNN